MKNSSSIKNEQESLTTQGEEYIIEESQEISIGETEGWTQKLKNAFPAFKHKNYRLYFSGMLVSLIGTWLQMVAQGYLVFELTKSAFWVGLVSALGSLPSLIFGLFAGVIVDRFPKNKLLIFTQGAELVLAFILGILALSDLITVEQIAAIAFLMGVVTAIDMPARQSFMVEVVGKEDLSSAIALNSGMFNAARVIGPATAGLLIGAIGTGGTFLVNAASFIPAIIVILMTKVSVYMPRIHPHPLKAVKEGVHYSFSHPIIRILLLFAGVNAIFGWSYIAIMPVIAKNVFEQDATGLGYLYAAGGVGAFAGSIIVSAFSKKISASLFIIGGNLIFAVSMIIFSISSNIFVAYSFLFLSGFGLLAHFSTMNTAIQHLVDDRVRGRVMSIYTLMFLGLSPLGSIEVGYLSQHFGSQLAVRVNSFIILVFVFLVYFTYSKIRTIKI